ncbi:hypothetical protein RclHR1_17090004 [Rhizophagus clarus]|uniref:Uncharacterized protein n=1 Tax=Rhizophagus clarus TaxID=94130 RepID=A0A2Z6QJC4_9GLOM|nr:hypothetical protein RclHR1_17090004 [Rhizophagus clarus]
MLLKIREDRPFILEEIHLSRNELVTFGLTEEEWKEIVEEERLVDKIRKGSSLEEPENGQRNKKMKTKEKSDDEEAE